LKSSLSKRRGSGRLELQALTALKVHSGACPLLVDGRRAGFLPEEINRAALVFESIAS
jgi:hypothetical protein